MKPTDNIGCAVQWNFPEMRHLERQFLPIEHRYVNPAPADLNNRALWRTCPLRNTVRAMIKLAPNLETFVLRSSPTNVLEIDVGGVRGGHLPAKYPVPEYLEYLRRALTALA